MKIYQLLLLVIIAWLWQSLSVSNDLLSTLTTKVTNLESSIARIDKQLSSQVVKETISPFGIHPDGVNSSSLFHPKSTENRPQSSNSVERVSIEEQRKMDQAKLVEIQDQYNRIAAQKNLEINTQPVPGSLAEMLLKQRH